MFILSQILKRLKVVLNVWNKENYGDVHKQVDIAMQNLKTLQEEIEIVGCSDDLLVQEESAQLDLNKALHAQELFWKEKARVDWYSSGDRNTTYFHKLVKNRNAFLKDFPAENW